MYIAPDKKKMAGYICASDEAGSAPLPVATCWIAMYPNSTGEKFAYLVTAKHVVERLFKKQSEAWVRLPGGVDLNAKAVANIPLSLAPADWLFHDDVTVDLAVYPFRPFDMAGTFHFDPLHLEQVDTVAEQVRRSGLRWPPLEGQDVMFIALMKLFPGVQSNTPIIRRGSIALITDEPIPGEYGRSEYHVIQAQSYPGNSGALVFASYDELRLAVPWGVMAYAYPSLEELKAVEGERNAYYNFGLGLVTPLQKVIGVLTSDEARERRD